MILRNKWLLLTSLYLSQGLPFGFFTQALPVLMREEGASLKQIGLSSLLFMPWALKWLWAPWVDAHGQRRSWIIPLQLASVATALLLAQVQGSVYWLKVAIVASAFIAATQDIPTDALAVALLPRAARGLGNAVQVGAYRLGMVIGGGALLMVLDQYGWAATFWVMAGCLLLAMLPVLLFTEAPRPVAVHRHPPVAALWQRLSQPGMAAFLLLLVAYKFGDAMASAMVKPLLVDAGFSKTAIGYWSGTWGSVAGLLGAICGGLLADRLGRRPALLLGGVGQSLAVACYAVAALPGAAPWVLKAALMLEHFLGGVATVSLFALMMDASHPHHAGVDYSLQACAVVITGGIAGAVAGGVGDAYGFAALFALGALCSALGCVALMTALHWRWGPPRIYASEADSATLAPTDQRPAAHT